MERRRARRQPMCFDVEVYGYDGELSLIHAYGMTDNVSRSGLFAFVDTGLPIGSRAVVTVRSRHPGLEPFILRGKVVRCSRENDGFGLAVHFDLEVENWAPQQSPAPTLRIT